MVSNCLKECLLNLRVVCPIAVRHRHQGDIYVFLTRINSSTDSFHECGQPDRLDTYMYSNFMSYLNVKDIESPLMGRYINWIAPSIVAMLARHSHSSTGVGPLSVPFCRLSAPPPKSLP